MSADDKQLRVTAVMASQIAGDVPHLDAILEYEMAQRTGLAHKIQRGQPCPAAGAIHIPMVRHTFGGVSHIAKCSSPICRVDREYVERFAKRLASEHSGLLAEEARLCVPVGNGPMKAYRLPLKVQCVGRVVWFCRGHRRPIKSLLRSVQSLGKKRSIGYGRVARWEIEEIEGDYSWFAKNDSGEMVLMRPLPFCDELPVGLTGYRRDFGACRPPYWHPERYGEIVTPC